MLAKRTSKLAVVFTTFLVSAFLFQSCTAGDGDQNDDDVTGSSTAFTLSAITDEGGSAVVSFDVAPDTTKFSVTASVGRDGFIRFDRVLSGSGDDYLNPDRETISLGEELSPFNNSVSVPSRREDPPLDSSERFTVTVTAAANEFGTPLVGETITFFINSKADPNVESGRLRINLFLVGDVAQTDSSLDIIRLAAQEFERIYSRSAAIEIVVEELPIEGPVVLPRPDLGNAFYKSASGGVPTPSVNVFVGGDISGFEGTGDVLGLASSIPGPGISTEKSAVAASLFAGAGPDGVYSSEEIRILGETLAHETGHFLGVFHPVDFDGGTVVALDPLDDTDSCSFITECVSNVDLISNLMFASPVTDGSGGFVPQDDLTADQRGVMNRYIAVD